MISHAYRCILIHIPRTGGSSIEHLLTGCDWWDTDPDTKHIPASAAKIIYLKWWDSYVTFTILRDEEERQQAYRNRFGDETRSDTSEFYLDLPLDHYLKFENLQVEWIKLARQLGAPQQLPHLR